MEDDTRAAPRVMTVAAIALVAVALAASAWLAGSSVAGAAGTVGGSSSTSSRFQPVQQSGDQAASDDLPDGGLGDHPCPEEEGGSGSGSSGSSGSSGQQDAPGAATPETEL